MSATARVLGRPEDQGMLYWFQMLYQWLELETDAELYSLTELHSKMVEFSGGSDVYTLKRLKQKLHEHYEDFVFFAEVDGCGTILCFRNMATGILSMTNGTLKKRKTCKRKQSA